MPAKSVSACPCQAFCLKLTVGAHFGSAYTKIETLWFRFLLGTTWLGVPPMRTAVATWCRSACRKPCRDAAQGGLGLWCEAEAEGAGRRGVLSVSGQAGMKILKCCLPKREALDGLEHSGSNESPEAGPCSWAC